MYTQKYRIRMYDVDANKIAKPSALLQEMQDTGDRQMFAEKPSYDEVFATGRAIMLNRLDMNILEEIHLEDVVTSASWPCPGRRATFLRCYGMWQGQGADQRMVAEISSQWSLVGLEDRKILPIDQMDFSNFTYGDYHEAAPGKFKVDKELEESMELVCEKKVGYSDADCNGHMNNTYYLNVLCDQIPELTAGTHRVSSVRLHYSREAVVGETIRVYRSEKWDRQIPEGLGQIGACVPEEELRNQPVALAVQAVELETCYQFKTLRASDGDLNVAAQIGIVAVKR
ncbi:MAG: hypothetical protein HFE73_05540 [Firmicutes bacterium]|nr:hypothetical protein [Bacillota bacterium]